MKRSIPAIVLIALGAWLIARCVSERNGSATNPQVRVVEQSGPDSSSLPSRHLTRHPTGRSPELPAQRLTIREPEQPPDGMNPTRFDIEYTYPTIFIQQLRRFRRESGVSEAQMQEVLMALYDYQEMHHYHFWRAVKDPAWGDDTEQWVKDTYDETKRRIDAALTPKQRHLFKTTVNPWAVLIFSPRVIAPAGSTETER